MMKSRSLLVVAMMAASLPGFGPGSLFAADESGERLTFLTDWKGERIDLPPGFAPAMTLKGIEEIRFAPGMFDAKSGSFFSYAFVFSVPKDQELTSEAIQREMLAYYRGLATAISKGKGRPVDASQFTFKMEQLKETTAAPEKIPASTKITQYSGELSWVEPFVTGQNQLLQFELLSWADPVTSRNYLFVCTSPKPPTETDGIWKELRQIRRTFEVAGK